MVRKHVVDKTTLSQNFCTWPKQVTVHYDRLRMPLKHVIVSFIKLDVRIGDIWLQSSPFFKFWTTVTHLLVRHFDFFLLQYQRLIEYYPPARFQILSIKMRTSVAKKAFSAKISAIFLYKTITWTSIHKIKNGFRSLIRKYNRSFSSKKKLN